MSKFIDFPESNLTLSPPAQGEKQPDGSVRINGTKVSALRVFRDDKQFVSCWELDVDELLEVIRTRRIWLYVLGDGHPPVHIQAGNPFTSPPGEFIPAAEPPATA